MNPDEIKAKAATLVELYAAVAEGKVLQLQTNIGWLEWNGNGGPVISADLSRWRIKPEPRRMWTNPGARTYHESTAQAWKSEGVTVTEWMEVLP